MTEPKGNTLEGQPPVTPAIPDPQPANGQPNAEPNPTPAPAVNAEIPGRLLDFVKEKASAKYGGDVEKTVEGLINAERKMHEATTEANELRKELEAEKLRHNVPPPPTVVDYEALYGRGQDQAMRDARLMQDAVAPMLQGIYESTAEAKLESVKIKLKGSDPQFTPEVEAKFDALIRSKDPRDRVIPQVITSCLNEAKSDNLENIVNAMVEARIKALQGNPQEPMRVARPGVQQPKTVKISKTPQEIQRIADNTGNSVAYVTKLYTEEA